MLKLSIWLENCSVFNLRWKFTIYTILILYRNHRCLYYFCVVPNQKDLKFAVSYKLPLKLKKYFKLLNCPKVLFSLKHLVPIICTSCIYRCNYAEIPNKRFQPLTCQWPPSCQIAALYGTSHSVRPLQRGEHWWYRPLPLARPLLDGWSHSPLLL